MTQDDRTAPLAELTAQGRNEDAYIWFREHQEQFSRREQQLIRAAPVSYTHLTLPTMATV